MPHQKTQACSISPYVIEGSFRDTKRYKNTEYRKYLGSVVAINPYEEFNETGNVLVK